jgi:hypothetical protein
MMTLCIRQFGSAQLWLFAVFFSVFFSMNIALGGREPGSADGAGG